MFRASLGIQAASAGPIDVDGGPGNADWIKQGVKADGDSSVLKPEWREAGAELVRLFGNVGDSKDVKTGSKLAAKLRSGMAVNADLVHLRDAVKAVAATLRESDRGELAALFSNANYQVRRAERSTRGGHA